MALSARAGAEPPSASPALSPSPELVGENPVTPGHAVPSRHETFQFDDRPLSVNVALGFGTPVGLAGLVVEYNPLPELAVGAGVERISKAPSWPPSRGFGRCIGRRRVFAIALSAALAEGPYSSQDDFFASLGSLMGPPKARSAWLDHALWFEPELQFEYQARSGFHLVLTGIGAAGLLNGASAECKEQPMNPGVTYDTTARCAMDSPIGAFTLELGYALP